jgi:DNA-binding LytR/AlgR family response regulator
MRPPFTCIVIDDDPSAISILVDHITYLPMLKLQKTYTKPLEALSDLTMSTQADLIFLDIDMPLISGIQLASSLKELSPKIIFTTAHDQYAIEAFKIRAKHYLLKPIDLDTFVQVVTDVIAEGLPVSSNVQKEEVLYVRPGERGLLTRIDKKDIMYMQTAGNYLHIFTSEQKYTVYMTIKEVNELLRSDERFFRIHKSFLINATYISKVVGNTVYLGKHPIPMSHAYKTDFVSYLDKNTLVSKRN